VTRPTAVLCTSPLNVLMVLISDLCWPAGRPLPSIGDSSCFYFPSSDCYSALSVGPTCPRYSVNLRVQPPHLSASFCSATPFPPLSWLGPSFMVIWLSHPTLTTLAFQGDIATQDSICFRSAELLPLPPVPSPLFIFRKSFTFFLTLDIAIDAYLFSPPARSLKPARHRFLLPFSTCPCFSPSNYPVSPFFSIAFPRLADLCRF